jgi:hypothetical protein
MRAQPVAARGAFLINTLHSPTRQILHVLPPVARTQENPRRPKQQDAGDCCAGALWCQDKTIQGIGAGLRRAVDFLGARGSRVG